VKRDGGQRSEARTLSGAGGAESAGHSASPTRPAEGIIHLGSVAHERWSVQQLVAAITDTELSSAESSRIGLYGRRVVCWAPTYWDKIPETRRRGNRVVCFFHHGGLRIFDDPQVIGGVCLNARVADELKRRQPGKPVWVSPVGGVEDALPHARRRHPGDEIRLLMSGDAQSPMTRQPGWTTGLNRRKGVELILPIADRLDRQRFSWVFVGKGWGPHAQALRARGWSVIYPGVLPSPKHYVYCGEGDVYLMLSRLEGAPLPLIEMMGLGMWPISTPTGVAPDLIVHGVNGHLVSPFDGLNVREVADEVALHLLSLEQTALRAARPRVRESVAHRTWTVFKKQVNAFIEACFDQYGDTQQVTEVRLSRHEDRH
jgi:glycosyltransferase involved in cell wall biosynthesis